MDSSGNDAMFAVLTHRPLFERVVAFQRGVPVLIKRFARINLPAEDEVERERYGIGRYWQSAFLYGSLNELQFLGTAWLAQDDDCPHGLRIPSVAFGASYFGRLDVLNWANHAAMEQGAWDGSLLYVAVLHKRYNAAMWLLMHRPDACVTDVDWALVEAVAYGKKELVEKIVTMRPDAVREDAMGSALRNLHWEVVMYLHEHTAIGCTPQAMDIAAAQNQMDVIEFIHSHLKGGWTAAAINQAVANGHLGVVRYLHKNYHEGCTKAAMDQAAANGHLAVVAFLYEHRYEGCTRDAITSAIKNEHMDVVKFLHQRRGMTVPESYLDSVIQSGKLEWVRYFHEGMGIPLTKSSYTRAMNSTDPVMIEYVTQRMSRKRRRTLAIPRALAKQLYLL